VSELPTGTVTFLLTDVEGSTSLWELAPSAMSAAIARHDELAAAVIHAHDGVLVKSRGEGDSIFSVFARATDAAGAAIALQRALHAEPWPDRAALRVRMALHTGEAELREGDYYGQVVNRCARLRAIGHGGQTLASHATYELVRDGLPDGASLRDLGSHRLRDLARPEQVWQLLGEELPADFPPLRSLDARLHNLPVQLTTFVGREMQTLEVGRLVRSSSLLTLTGAGGCGKTRLALQVAADVLDDFADGIWLTELARLTDPQLVAQEVARVTGAPDDSTGVLDRLVSHLRAKSTLLVLDNCEHVVDACAEMATTLLETCPGVRILATSREALGVAGETAWRVPSLTIPDVRHLPTPEAMTQYEAIRLFVDRAVQARSDFCVNNDNAPAVAEICHRLDGIPLAIELAAARMRMLTAQEIHARLDDRFRLLTGGSRTALPRQQTLRALIDWSYDLLSERERTLLRRLSIFMGRFTLEGAEHVCADDEIDDLSILDLLGELVDKSLVLAEENHQTRYRMLETVRQYVREKLVDSGDAVRMREAHMRYFAELAPTLVRIGVLREKLDAVEAEHDNIRAALEWSIGEADARSALQLAGALAPFWRIRAYRQEGARWLLSALELPGEVEPGLRAKALGDAGALLLSADESRAEELLRAGYELYEALGDPAGMSRTIHLRANLACARGDYELGVSLFERTLELNREAGNPRAIAASLNALGNLAMGSDFDLARTRFEEGLSMARELGDSFIATQLTANLGSLAREEGDRPEARRLLRQAVQMSRDDGNIMMLRYNLSTLATVEIEDGALDLARSYLEEICRLARDSREPSEEATGQVQLGLLALHEADLDGAAVRFDRAIELSGTAGYQGTTILAVGGLVEVDIQRGDLRSARRRAQSAFERFRADGQSVWGVSMSLIALADVARYAGDWTAAAAPYREALTVLGGASGGVLAACCEGLAGVAAAGGDGTTAATLLGFSASARERGAGPLPPYRRAVHDRDVAAARAAAGSEEQFSRAFEAGRAMTRTQAHELALGNTASE
jgi:predicted ATPase/class 3 adenylate cyclase